MFTVNQDLDQQQRFDLARFVEWTGPKSGYDVLTAGFFDLLGRIPSAGEFKVSDDEGRPDLVSFKLYRSTQYWWLLMAYNGLVANSDMVAGTIIQYPALQSLEQAYFKLVAQEAPSPFATFPLDREPLSQLQENLPVGIASGGISFELDFEPEILRVWAEMPRGGGMIEARVVADSLSKGGFNYVLSGITDVPGYVLRYYVVKPSDEVLVEGGLIDLEINQVVGSISNLRTSYKPQAADTWVDRPADGGFYMVRPVVGTVSLRGFDFSINSALGEAGYKLGYLMVPTGTPPVVEAPAGSLELDNAVASGVVSGLDLKITPSAVRMWVDPPSGGGILEARLTEGTLTQDGFSFELGALTDSIGYKLNYLFI